MRACCRPLTLAALEDLAGLELRDHRLPLRRPALTRLPSDLRVFPLFEKGHFTGDDKTSQFSLFNAAGRLSVQSSRDFWLGPQSGEKHQVSIGRAVGLEDGRLVVVHRSVGFS